MKRLIAEFHSSFSRLGIARQLRLCTRLIEKVLILTCLSAFSVYAQPQKGDVIMIGTSVDIPGTHKGKFDGFGKFVSPKRPYTKSSSISYYLGSKDKNCQLELNHVNFNTRTKPDLAVIDVRIKELSDWGTVIDIDEFIASKSREEIYKWALENTDNSIWIIDRRDFYKSYPELKEPDMMKVVQCEIWIDFLPDDILNPEILNIHAQMPSEIIFIGTSFDIPPKGNAILDGFGKLTSPQYKWTKTDTCSYDLASSGKNFRLTFRHVNFKNQAKPDLVVLDSYISELYGWGTIIDIDEFIASKSREEIYQWALENIDNRIWIIDRRDFYKSDPKLKEPNMMKVVQCEIWIQDIPEDILNPEIPNPAKD